MANTRWIYAEWAGASKAAYRKKEWIAVNRKFRLRMLKPCRFSRLSKNVTTKGASISSKLRRDGGLCNRSSANFRN
jgi:hypothetical protein